MMSYILLDYADIKGIFSSFESAQHYDLCMNWTELNYNVIRLFKQKNSKQCIRI